MFFSFTERISCIIIAGGNDTSVEVLTGELGTKQLPNLPEDIYGRYFSYSSMDKVSVSPI